MKLTKKFFCPVNGWDCPYWNEDGSCSMVDDGDNPLIECDDALVVCCDDPDDAFVWADEDGATYDVEGLLELGYHFVNGEPVKAPSSDFIKATLEKVLEHWDEEVSFPPEFDEMGSNGLKV